MYRDSESTKGVINGPRPLPLRINKDSHAIHKPHHNPSSRQLPTDAAAGKIHGQSAAKRQPVIIYTHSPKVIYAQACDFMAIVQNLTGLKRNESSEQRSPEVTVKEEDSFSDEKDCSCGGANNNAGYLENNESTSVITDELNYIGDVKQDSTAVSPMFNTSSNSFFDDAPLFTPNPSELYCSARPTSLFQPPNMMLTSISPSFMEYMKAFPGY